MTSFAGGKKLTPARRLLCATGAVAALVSAPAGLSAQSPPPVQGTIALESTMKTFYRGLNSLLVTTIDGVEHVYNFTKGLVVQGGKGTETGKDQKGRKP